MGVLDQELVHMGDEGEGRPHKVPYPEEIQAKVMFDMKRNGAFLGCPDLSRPVAALVRDMGIDSRRSNRTSSKMLAKLQLSIE